MAAKWEGIHDWVAKRDKKGERVYTLTTLISTDDVNDGPGVVLNEPTLPSPGDPWTYGNTSDAWAVCNWETSCRPHGKQEGTNANYWLVTNQFTNASRKQDRSSQQDNPLTAPYEISGGWNQVARAKSVDKDGNYMTNSAFEPFKGDLLQRNEAQPTVSIKMNLPTVPLDYISVAMNRVNDAPLWGLGARHVRLYDAPWSRQVTDANFVYYTVEYAFECNFNSWDEPLIDQGLKVLREGGDKTNPLHFERANDLGGEKEDDPKLLDGNGSRLAAGASVVYITPEIDLEFNFLLLGIPTAL